MTEVLSAAGLAPWDASPGPSLRAHAAFEPWPADDYRTVRVIAHAPANSGVVEECVHLPTGVHCVVKRMPNSRVMAPSSRTEDAKVDIGVSSFLDKNRSASLDLGRNLATSSEAYQDEECTYFVSELLPGGELFGHVSERRFDEPTAQRYGKQLVEGVASLHASGIAHRDITLENLVLDAADEVRLIDFGLAVPLSYGEEKYSGVVGKNYYIAPEMYRGDYQVRPVDAWAVGITIFIMIAGIPPWALAKNSDKNFRYFLAHGLERYITVLGLRDLFSGELLDLLQHLLKTNPEDRMTIEAARRHPWFQAAALR